MNYHKKNQTNNGITPKLPSKKLSENHISEQHAQSSKISPKLSRKVLHYSLSKEALTVFVLFSMVQAFIIDKYATVSWRHSFFSNWLTIAEMESCHQIVFAEELLLFMFFLHFTHFGKPFSEQKFSFIGTSWLLTFNLF